jgi:HrpA-like RNA helicase
MALLPKEDREERAVLRLLEYYNHTHGTSYEISEWLDRSPRVDAKAYESIPDCLCTDAINLPEMVVECTMLTGSKDLRLSEGAQKFLEDVRERLTCKLPGVFFLYDWGVDAIRFTARNKEKKITEFCQEILAVAPKLAEGDEVTVSQPYLVKLRKEEADRVTTDSGLVWVLPEIPRLPKVKQLTQILDEANRKFTRYSDRQTILLINIWETGLDYKAFEEELFQQIATEKYPNIKHIYLSEGSPDPPVYHLWPNTQ